ncbi:MAG: chalcone isomerase family protein [Pseudomonadota bacterium]
MSLAQAAVARDIAGVAVADTTSVPGTATTLVLNGAGLRTKLFVKVYVAALYLTAVSRDADQLIGADAPRRLSMNFVRDVSGKKMADAWHDGFSANHTPEQLKPLQARIADFVTLFGDVAAGDSIWLDYLPGSGTRVSLNNRELGTIPGKDFNDALLRIWLGKQPVAVDLKKALLGIN